MAAEATEAAWDELTLSPDEYRRASTRYRRRRSRTAYFFILPYFIPFLAFLVVPVFWSIYLSFISIKAALDITTGQTLATILLSIIPAVFISAIILAPIAMLGR